MDSNIYYCPINGSKLRLAPEDILTEINTSISQGELRYEDGDIVKGPLQKVLLNNDHSLGYVIHDDIPRLLPGLAVSLQGVNTVKSVD